MVEIDLPRLRQAEVLDTILPIPACAGLPSPQGIPVATNFLKLFRSLTHDSHAKAREHWRLKVVQHQRARSPKHSAIIVQRDARAHAAGLAPTPGQSNLSFVPLVCAKCSIRAIGWRNSRC
jgi:hypothetical protein